MTETSTLVYVSYTQKDSGFVARLERSLSHSGFVVWVDHKRDDSKGEWPQRLHEIIERCSTFIVVVTPASLKSGWVREEYLAALALDKKIIPVILTAGTTFPPELNHLQWIDCSKLYAAGLIALLLALDADQTIIERLRQEMQQSMQSVWRAGWGRFLATSYLGVARAGLLAALSATAIFALMTRGIGATNQVDVVSLFSRMLPWMVTAGSLGFVIEYFEDTYQRRRRFSLIMLLIRGITGFSIGCAPGILVSAFATPLGTLIGADLHAVGLAAALILGILGSLISVGLFALQSFVTTAQRNDAQQSRFTRLFNKNLLSLFGLGLFVTSLLFALLTLNVRATDRFPSFLDWELVILPQFSFLDKLLATLWLASIPGIILAFFLGPILIPLQEFQAPKAVFVPRYVLTEDETAPKLTPLVISRRLVGAILLFVVPFGAFSLGQKPLVTPTVYIATNAHVAAIHNGKVLWNYTAPGMMPYAPVVTPHIIYAVSSSKQSTIQLDALDITHGSVLWSFHMPAKSLALAPFYSDNLLLLETTTTTKAGNDALVITAISVATHTQVWRFQSQAYSGTPIKLFSANGEIYALTNFSVIALNPLTGKLVDVGASTGGEFIDGLAIGNTVYTIDNFGLAVHPNGKLATGVGIAYTAPYTGLVAAPPILYATEGGGVIAFSLASNQLLWEYVTNATLSNDVIRLPHVPRLIATAQVFYLCENDGIFRILDPINQKEIIQFGFPDAGNVTCAPVTNGKLIFALSSSGEIFAYDPVLRQETWLVTSTNGLFSAVATDQAALYIGTDRGVVSAINAVTGQIKWKVPFAEPIVDIETVPVS